MFKRLFDIFFSFWGLFFFLPFFAVVGLLIKYDSYGPIFFTQKRVGKGGRLFTLYKFRSMTHSNVACVGDFYAGDTSRVTKLGRIIRKLKIDELPQLFNVLKGDMSFVGPRPEVYKWTQFYNEKWAIVHMVRPGITDNAAILFRNEEEMLSAATNAEILYRDVILPRKIELYVDYVNNHSVLVDLLIILRTLKSL